MLKSVAHSLATEISTAKQESVKATQYVEFVREGWGKRKKSTTIAPNGFLQKADDWVLLVDVESRLSIPRDIVITNLRPDIVLYSRKEKLAILIELTVPWEDRLEESHQIKAAKYADLVTAIASNGWQSRCYPIEVGTRGFPATSLRRMFLDIGLSCSKTRRACKSAGNTAERASQWLWYKRKDKWQNVNSIS